MAACACIKTPPANSSNSPASALRSTLRERQPEDATLGQNAPRPQDYNDPDPPKSILISSRAFADDPTQNLREQP